MFSSSFMFHFYVEFFPFIQNIFNITSFSQVNLFFYMLSFQKKLDENILFIYTGNNDNLSRAQMPTVPRIQPPFSNPSIKTRKMGLPSSCPQRHIKGLKISAPRVLLMSTIPFPGGARWWEEWCTRNKKAPPFLSPEA